MPSRPPKAVDFVPQVRAVSLCDYVRIAQSVGLDAYALLAEHGIDPRLLSTPEARLPAAAVSQLLEESARRSGVEAFGLLLAEARSFASLGPLSLLMRHERTLRDVIGRVVEYRRLMSDVQEIELREDGGEAELAVGIVSGVSARQAAELAMALTLRFISGAMFGGWPPASAHFRHPAPADLGVHQRVFRCPLRFGSDIQGFRFPAASLERENAFADPGFVLHAKDHVDLLLRDLPQLSLAEQVREAIASLLPSGAATLKKVSERLQIHPRALQRKLTAEGLAFTELVDSLREKMARELLSGTELPVSEVAMLTGYATATSFSRWFAERLGQPPREWRLKRRT
jgi:AraC-like DNA-binding protein